MSISLRSNADGSGTLLNGATPIMEVTAAGVVSLPNIAAGSSANQPVNLGQFIGTNVSLSANGYQKLPSGLIIQWGSFTNLAGFTLLITLPISFPNSFFYVGGSMAENNNGYLFRARIASLSTFQINKDTFSVSANPNTSQYWLAIGN